MRDSSKLTILVVIALVVMVIFAYVVAPHHGSRQNDGIIITTDAVAQHYERVVDIVECSEHQYVHNGIITNAAGVPCATLEK